MLMSRRPRRESLFSFSSVIKFGLFLLVPCFVWLAANVGALEEYVEALKARNAIREPVAELKIEVSDMKFEVKELEDRGFADEVAARVLYKMIMPGETMCFIEWEDDQTSPYEEE